MPDDIVKSQIRFPKDLHKSLGEANDLTGQSQNQFVCDCVEAIVHMIQAENEADITIPDIVIRARAAAQNRKTPKRIYTLNYDALLESQLGTGTEGLKAAEDPPPDPRKALRRAAGK